MDAPKLKRLAEIVGIVGVFNFVVFVLLALLLGGDAMNGYESIGHHYLRLGARVTEVSYPIFLYSRIHASLLCFNYIAMFVLLALAAWAKHAKKDQPKTPPHASRRLRHYGRGADDA